METVNLTDFFSWTALLHTIRAIVTFNITNATLKSKYNPYITFFIMTGTCVSYSALFVGISTAQNEVLLMTFYYVVAFIAICFLYNGTIFAKLFTTIFSLSAYLISSFCATVLLKLFFPFHNICHLRSHPPQPSIHPVIFSLMAISEKPIHQQLQEE